VTAVAARCAATVARFAAQGAGRVRPDARIGRLDARVPAR
jgi:hypothetical protein